MFQGREGQMGGVPGLEGGDQHNRSLPYLNICPEVVRCLLFKNPRGKSGELLILRDFQPVPVLCRLQWRPHGPEETTQFRTGLSFT